ncbi:MAG: hypothetical protein Q8L80_04930 [Gallionella sp.]|nr:hypothetical protein [Gallionella sp.]
MAIERVAMRVRQGGHNIPEEVIRRRYVHGVVNFERYKMLVHTVIGDRPRFPLIEEARLD